MSPFSKLAKAVLAKLCGKQDNTSSTNLPPTTNAQKSDYHLYMNIKVKPKTSSQTTSYKYHPLEQQSTITSEALPSSTIETSTESGAPRSIPANEVSLEETHDNQTLEKLEGISTSVLSSNLQQGSDQNKDVKSNQEMEPMDITEDQALYSDTLPDIAAREHVGCYSVSEVRASLHQPPPAEKTSLGYWQRTKAAAELRHRGGLDVSEDLISVRSNDHYRPGCSCVPLHYRCNNSEQASNLQPIQTNSSNRVRSVRYSLMELREAAEAGCWFCSIIYGGVKASPLWDASRCETVQTDFKEQDSFVNIKPQDYGTWGCTVNLNWQQNPRLTFYTELGAPEPRCELLRTRGEFSEPNAISSIREFALQNRGKCDRSHSCKSYSGCEVPTRLLDIQVESGKYAVRLVEAKTSAVKEPYVTLSHCWGTNFTATLTDSTMEEMKKGVDWWALPQTFRDAIAVTHDLGYRYLWIDALCIIQDNRPDWEYESARMNQVYANCDLMLSADRAVDGRAGLLTSSQLTVRSWEPLVSKDTQYATRVRFQKRHRVAGSMFATEAESIYISPLHRRGWCFQELMMAPRILHFAIDELMWECNGDQLCQCGEIKGFGDKSVLTEYRAKGCTGKQKTGIWRVLIFRYSERLLTKWTDRLPAISGLAKQFMADTTLCSTQPLEGERLPFDQIDLGTYLAGLWSKSLRSGLCWRVDADHKPRISPNVAPSWSWASVRGRINWPDIEDSDTIIEILDARCEPAGLDTTGAVSSGQLVLSGSAIPLQLFLCNQKKPDGTWLSCTLIKGYDPDADVHTYIGAYHADAVIDFPSNYPYSTYYDPDQPSNDLRMVDDSIEGILMTSTIVLVVKRSRGSMLERIGIIDYEFYSGENSDKSRFFKNAQKRTFVIV